MLHVEVNNKFLTIFILNYIFALNYEIKYMYGILVRESNINTRSTLTLHKTK